ncbi:MAG: hypothetical protein Kow0042_21970 [Calditrichia bacterium]
MFFARKPMTPAESTGNHQLTWDATNNYSRRVPGGTNFYQLKNKNFQQVKRMLLMKLGTFSFTG